jgi:hypothetical protein
MYSGKIAVPPGGGGIVENMFGLFYFSLHLVFGHGLHIFAFIFHYIYRCFSFICYVLCYLVLRYLYLFVLHYLQFPSYFILLNLLL